MSGATAPCAPPSPAPQSPLGATRALAPRARRTAAGGVFGPGRVGLRLHLGQLRRAPVAAAGAALPPACAAPGGREGERPAVGVRVVGGEGGGMGSAFPSCAPEPHSSPLRALDPPHHSPSLVLSAPHGCIPPPISPLIAYPIPSFASPLPILPFPALCLGPRLLLPPSPLLSLSAPIPPPFSIPTPPSTLPRGLQPQTSFPSRSFCPLSIPLAP